MDLSLIWIPSTVAAAAAQTARNAMQHRLTEVLGTVGATQVRFLYGLPFALLFLLLLTGLTGEAVPPPNARFLAAILAGALLQIAATGLMLAAMRARSFGAVIAYTKTEPVQVALFGAIILGDPLGLTGALAIVVATAGVFLLSGRKGPAAGGGWAELLPPLMGIAAGGAFALAAVGFRGAILALPEGSPLMRSTTSLAWTLAAQTLVLVAWLAVMNRPALVGSLRIWRSSLFAGFMGALASQCWFFGFAVTAAANVRTLGLVEVLFAAIVSRRVFVQTIAPVEWLGYALVCGGIALLVLNAA
ncbi:EamA family transporter [Marinivivus vitaminiproducens]|uniref:EamA family transporter n=1 Tax=Marinivivus vitaminiproducens TaxID=3035935 RepID=UPI0027A1E0CF|nr:EamA family transporter [Geminicoccaceae bacterium SCSIO 64248]